MVYLVVVVFDPVFGVKQDDGVRQANFAAKRCSVTKNNIFLVNWKANQSPALDGFRSTGERNGTETGRNGKGMVPV